MVNKQKNIKRLFLKIKFSNRSERMKPHQVEEGFHYGLGEKQKAIQAFLKFDAF